MRWIYREEVETTFKPTTDAILKTVDEQLEETKIRVRSTGHFNSTCLTTLRTQYILLSGVSTSINR